jgi:hypothetical protein
MLDGPGLRLGTDTEGLLWPPMKAHSNLPFTIDRSFYSADLKA